MRRSEPGFTLLEVLAAVALLGIVYTVLATAAMQGLRSEGVARRRMEASLLLDERLADLERDLAAGLVPPLGTSEEEEEDFRITIDVQPFEPPAGLLDDPAQAGGAQAGGALGSFLAVVPGEPPVVSTIDLTVTWAEGIGEESLQRTTFGYDVSALPLPEADLPVETP